MKFMNVNKIYLFFVLLWISLFSLYAYREIFQNKRTIISNSLESLVKSDIAFSGGDTYDYILPAYQIIKTGKPVFEFEDGKYIFARRDPMSYLVFIPFMFLFDKYFVIATMFVIIILFLYSNYILFKKIDEFTDKRWFILYIAFFLPLYTFYYVPRLMTEGFVSILIIWFVINYINYIKLRDEKFLLNSSLFLILSGVFRGEFLFVSLVFIILYLSIFFKSILRIAQVILLIFIITFKTIWGLYFGETTGIWEWSYRGLLTTYNGIDSKKSGEIYMMEIANIIKMPYMEDFNFEFFIKSNSHPYYKVITEYNKDRCFYILKNSKEAKIFVLYRLFIRNPYIFIFRNITNAHIFEKPFLGKLDKVLSKISYIYSFIFFICLIICFIFGMKDKSIRNVLIVYFVLFLVYDIYYFAGGVMFTRLSSIYIYFEILIMLLALKLSQSYLSDKIFKNS